MPPLSKLYYSCQKKICIIPIRSCTNQLSTRQQCCRVRKYVRKTTQKMNHVNDNKFFINLFKFSTILWSPCEETIIFFWSSCLLKVCLHVSLPGLLVILQLYLMNDKRTVHLLQFIYCNFEVGDDMIVRNTGS